MEFSFDTLTKWVDAGIEAGYKNSRQVLYALVAVLILIGVFWGYSYYDSSMQAQAHKAFVNALKYYDAAVVPGSAPVTSGPSFQFGSDVEKWKTVEEVFADAAVHYKGTRLGSVFQAYQADAQVALKKYDDAIVTLTNAIRSMPSEEVKDFYKVKLALIKTDSSKQDVVNAGLTELTQIAENAASVANEEALYYIGAYFWVQKDYAQVRNYWQQLMVKYGLKSGKQQSGFAELVRSKLKLISADW